MKTSLNLPPLKLLCGVSFAVFLAGCSHHQDQKQENNLVMLTTYLNATTPPQPSQETCSVSYVNTHLQLAKAEEYATGLYLLKPIKNQKLRQYIIWGWQNAAWSKQTTTYSKQVDVEGKQVTALGKQILQGLNHDNPQNSSFMNKMNALIRQSLPLTNQFEQKTNQFEQDTQKFEKYNNKFAQLAKVTTPRIVAFNKAVAATKNGNYADLSLSMSS